MFRQEDGPGGLEEIRFTPMPARYICLLGSKRGTDWGYSLWEFTPRMADGE
jgi:chondroitin AC lyase